MIGLKDLQKKLGEITLQTLPERIADDLDIPFDGICLCISVLSDGKWRDVYIDYIGEDTLRKMNKNMNGNGGER